MPQMRIPRKRKMKYWNYRVMKRQYANDCCTYGIYEVYYDNKDKPEGWTQDSVPPVGDSLKELKDDFKFYKQALDKPILDYKTGKEIEGK